MTSAAATQAAADAALADEVARVVAESGGSLRLGSFFLHRPDMKRLLMDRKLKDFLEEPPRDARFVLEDPEDDAGRPAATETPAKRTGRVFGGAHGLIIKLADPHGDPAVAALARTATAAANTTTGGDTVVGVANIYAPYGFATSTDAARTALNSLHKIATCELEELVTKYNPGEGEAAAAAAAATAPDGGIACKDFPPRTLRVGFISSRSTRVRKKLRASYALAPNAGVMRLFPTPKADRAEEINRTSVLHALYLLRFFESQPGCYELVDGPQDLRCNQHHCPRPARCVCNTYVRLVDEDPTEYEKLTDEKRDALLEDRVKALVKGSNPRKGVDLAWIGQDPKVKKLLHGRQFLACVNKMFSVELFELGTRWKVRYSEAQRREWAASLAAAKANPDPAANSDGGDDAGSDAPEAPAKRRKIDWAAPQPGAAKPNIVVLGAADGLVALDKPPNVTTERVLDAVPHDVVLCGGASSKEVVSISRLDQETSGVLLFATSLPCEEYMKSQYKAHAVAKRYTALCCGHPPAEGRIESKLLASDTPGKNRVRVHKNGKPSITEYAVRRRYRAVKKADVTPEVAAVVRGVYRACGGCADVQQIVGRVLAYFLPPPSSTERFSLLDVRPLTGRQHQIRVHMLSKGHPLVADARYGKRTQVHQQLAWCPRNFLHCSGVAGTDQGGGQYSFDSPLPADLAKALQFLVPME